MVISTGMTFPRMASVWALYALQKSMMLTPCGPSAVPTGGAGVAAPACSCTLTSAAIFFLGGIAVLPSLPRGHDGLDALPHLPGFETRPAPPRFAQVYVDAPQPLTPLVPFASSGHRGQTFWIWLKLSSTGVSRPKISTRALTRCASALISVIVAWRV